MAIPVVAIVGRPNVGKSALFNRLARRQISLVHDRPGVTRDRIIADCAWEGKPFTLIDTGGIGLEDNSGFEKAVQREVALAVESVVASSAPAEPTQTAPRNISKEKESRMPGW